MPPSFRFPADAELWMQTTSAARWRSVERERYSDWGRVVGRLKPGVTIAQAQAEMTAIGRQLEVAFPPAAAEDAADFAGFGVNVVPLTVQVFGRQLPQALWVLFGAVVFVLLIACANVANLLLARGASREREFALRQTLGASRPRLVRQLLTESLLLAGAAGVAGLLIAVAAIRIVTTLGSRSVPRLDEVSLDVRVLAFTITATLAAGFLFGLAPAVGLARDAELNRRSSHSGPGTPRVRRAIVVVEVALSAVLLCGAGLLLRSFVRLQSVHPGFEAEHVLTMRVALAGRGAAIVAAEADILERVRALPGVTAAGLIEDVLQRRNPDYSVTVDGRAIDSSEPISGDALTPGALEALGVRLVRGRLFSETDRGGRRIAIINETAARHFFSGADPIGRELGDRDPRQPRVRIVGVVSDMRRQGLERRPIAQLFWPYFQRASGTMDLVVRSAVNPVTLAPAVRRAIAAVDGRAPVFNVSTLDRRLDESLAPRRMQSVLLALFAAMALVLAAIGVYGLMHYAVAQRTREIGIRAALGARVPEILVLVFQQGIALILIGIGLGLAGALAVTRVLRSLLFEVSATDPTTFAIVGIVLAAAALTACYVPARRATRIDPVIALKCE
jgi:putative ABC transport system permease protein